ncbi:peroxisomal nicotinamide adenine dinucleotide carrier-like [Typha latifolia]|uniref:peroxisomal nicotinamide adenine dinucleotide carrier-like n=1 Tax=Typha latifolia TaxID=4733 RepID=UPI003C2F8F95
MSNAVANGLAGAGGGIIAQIITYPLQTVNTRQQTDRTAKKRALGGLPSPLREKGDIEIGKAPADSSPNSSSSSNGGTLFQILQVIRSEGWGGLYSGLKPSLIGTAASQGIYYYFYQVLKNKVEAAAVARKKKGLGDGTVGMLSWLVVAAIAGSVNVLLTNPIWVLVTRMQTHTQAERKIMEAKREDMLRKMSATNSVDISDVKDKFVGTDSIKPRPYGTFDAAREVYDETGIKGFWKGLIPTLIMVCNPSIQFMIYETSIKHLQTKRLAIKSGIKNLTALEVFLLGAVAKLGATISTYPLLVVKSRLQAKQEIGRNVMLRYTGTLDAIVKMIRYEGLYGFYKGMGTKIVQSVFAASVLFMVKEELVKAFLFLADESRKILVRLKKE